MKINKKMLIIALVIIAIIGAVLAIVISQTTKITNESYANCAIGDVNGDGYINTSDSLLIQKFVQAQVELFETQQKNADVNLDGKIDNQDSELILRYTTGTVRKLPVTDGADSGSSDNSKLVRCKTEDVETTVKVVNKWSSGDGKYSYQLNISTRNLKSSRLKGWETTITANSEMEISKSWDCECDIEGNKIIITGDSIPTETVGVCGVIVTGPENLLLESVVTE